MFLFYAYSQIYHEPFLQITPSNRRSHFHSYDFDDFDGLVNGLNRLAVNTKFRSIGMNMYGPSYKVYIFKRSLYRATRFWLIVGQSAYVVIRVKIMYFTASNVFLAARWPNYRCFLKFRGRWIVDQIYGEMANQQKGAKGKWNPLFWSIIPW